MAHDKDHGHTYGTVYTNLPIFGLRVNLGMTNNYKWYLPTFVNKKHFPFASAKFEVFL
jgi:hypothetical protein